MRRFLLGTAALFLLGTATFGDARELIEAGEFDAAVRSAKAGVKAEPESAEAHLILAEALRAKMWNGSRVKAMMSIGSYKKALRRALELAPDDVDAREEEIGFLINAPGIAGGDKQRALARARELAAIDAARGRSMQIEALFALERDEQAFELLRSAVAADPSDAAARYRLGTLLQARERWEEADAALAPLAEDAGAEERYRYAALYQLGRSRVLGNFELRVAIAHFERFLAEAPAEMERSHVGAHWRKGMALEALGDPDGARASYRAALALDPDHERAGEALRKLER